MFPFGGLPENLTAFGAQLRERYGFRLGPRQIHDAARALQLISIADERAVRDTLRPILCGTVDETRVFDEAFSAFFYPGHASNRQTDRLVRRSSRADGAATAQSTYEATTALEKESAAADARLDGSGFGDAISVEEAREEATGLLRSSYSPLAGEGTAPALSGVDRAWRDAAAAFVRRVQTALSRRWRPAQRGPRFDLRRTLRSSLHTGGEPVLPRWRARPRLRPRFVVIVDGSRSMSAYSEAALRIAVALANVVRSIEVFAFSTELQRITPAIRRAASGEHVVLPYLRRAWGGGTGIGQCLHDFLHRFGERLIGRDTVVIIASDGLDVGQPDLLRQATADLRRRSAGIIWLNPLTETRGYEPTATGMSAARPFVSTFTWVGSASSLARLARVVRVTR
jgi:uncharacterized protein